MAKDYFAVMKKGTLCKSGAVPAAVSLFRSMIGLFDILLPLLGFAPMGRLSKKDESENLPQSVFSIGLSGIGVWCGSDLIFPLLV